jgi:serine/threonine protein kinase
MGTPTEDTWPGLSELQDYKKTYPKWAPKNFVTLCPKLCKDGIDLLQKLIAINPINRITAQEALTHVKFLSLFSALLQ